MKGKRSQEKRKSFGRKDRRKEEEKIPPDQFPNQIEFKREKRKN